MNLVSVGHHTVRHPCAVTAPTCALEILGGSTPKRGQAELIVFGVFCEVGVQANIKSFGQLGTCNKEMLAHAEWRARRQRDTHHRSVRPVVMTPHCRFGCGEDVVVVMDHIVGR